MTQSTQSVLINGFGVLFVILNSFGLGLRLPIGKLLAQVFAHWKIAVWARWRPISSSSRSCSSAIC